MDNFTIKAITNEPRILNLDINGKIVPLNIPNPSIRKFQKMVQKYWLFSYAKVHGDGKTMAKISMGVAVEVFKQYRPYFTKWWIMHHIDSESFIEIVDFIFAPAREYAEEQSKNMVALPKTQN